MEIFPDLPPVLTDEIHLEKILHNLMQNADKYSPAGMPIYLCACQEGDKVRISIKDHGLGVPIIIKNPYPVGVWAYILRANLSKPNKAQLGLTAQSGRRRIPPARNFTWSYQSQFPKRNDTMMIQIFPTYWAYILASRAISFTKPLMGKLECGPSLNTNPIL